MEKKDPFGPTFQSFLCGVTLLTVAGHWPVCFSIRKAYSNVVPSSPSFLNELKFLWKVFERHSRIHLHFSSLLKSATRRKLDKKTRGSRSVKKKKIKTQVSSRHFWVKSRTHDPLVPPSDWGWWTCWILSPCHSNPKGGSWVPEFLRW